MSYPEDFERLFDVSRETLSRLSIYEKLLKKWTAKINLVSKSTLDDVWGRHFVDSAQVYQAMDPGFQRVSDLGSGGGFPGLVVAILNAEFQPDSHVTMIESDVRKASFLSTVVRELGLNAQAVPERIEAAPQQEVSVVTARALASLDALLPLVGRHLAPGGTALFLKGERHEEEVDVARAAWEFDLETRKSMTQPGAALLSITNLRMKP